MLARLQQFTTFCLLAAAVVWVSFHLSRGQPGWAAAGLVVILLGYALVLGLEFGLMAFSNRNDPLPAAPLADVAAAWWGEVCSAPLVFCWQQPFRSRATPDRLTGRPGQRGLVLVHGFICNRGVWNTWFPRLNERGIPFVAVDLEPVFGDIDAYAAQIETAVAALRASTGLPPVVVAHSMGGLAVRAWLRSRGGRRAIEEVHHIVTLGTPHGGTALARLSFSGNTRQMLQHSAWLNELAAGETAEQGAKFTCLYSNCDNIVFPTSTATLPHAKSRRLSACAHVHMVFHPESFDEVLGHLLSGTDQPAPDAMPSSGRLAWPR